MEVIYIHIWKESRFGEIWESLYLILLDIGPLTSVETYSPRCRLGIPANRDPTPPRNPDRSIRTLPAERKQQ